MKSISIETLKPINVFKKEKVAILFDNKDLAELAIEQYAPDYFNHSYRFSNEGKYLMVFTDNWITGEDIFLVYDLDAKFKYIDDNTYSMELTEENILNWIKSEYDVDSLLLFKN